MPSLSLKCFETILLSAMLMILSFYITQQKLCSGYKLVCGVTLEFMLQKQLLAHIDYKCVSNAEKSNHTIQNPDGRVMNWSTPRGTFPFHPEIYFSK